MLRPLLGAQVKLDRQLPIRLFCHFRVRTFACEPGNLLDPLGRQLLPCCYFNEEIRGQGFSLTGLKKHLTPHFFAVFKKLLRVAHLLQVRQGVGGRGQGSFLLFILPPFLGARRRLLPRPLSPFASRFLGLASSICLWQRVAATSKSTLHRSRQSLLT